MLVNWGPASSLVWLSSIYVLFLVLIRLTSAWIPTIYNGQEIIGNVTNRANNALIEKKDYYYIGYEPD
jgi:hypothetical protein